MYKYWYYALCKTCLRVCHIYSIQHNGRNAPCVLQILRCGDCISYRSLKIEFRQFMTMTYPSISLSETFDVRTSVVMKTSVFCDIAPCFGGTCRLYPKLPLTFNGLHVISQKIQLLRHWHSIPYSEQRVCVYVSTYLRVFLNRVIRNYCRGFRGQ
jgi:hypothetical protein